MKKLSAIFNLFRRGSQVADPALWKARQMEATAVAALIVAVLQTTEAFGYDFPMDPDTVTAIAVGFIAVVNWVFTLTTTKKIGLPPLGETLPVQSAGQVHSDEPDYRG